MASVFKPKGSNKYVAVYFDHNNERRWETGTRDKAVTQRIANGIEENVVLRKASDVDPKQEAFTEHASASLLTHADASKQDLESRGGTNQQLKLHSSRALRIIALIKGGKLTEIDPPRPATRARVKKAEAVLRSLVDAARVGDLTAENVQKALAKLINEGRSLQTANHHRNAVKSIARWLHETGGMREYTLRRVAGFNAKEDPRHERRTISLGELRRSIEAAQAGKAFKRMSGPMPALCYRLAVASGLRYSELGSITPESFDWKSGTVTINAAYAKNGETAVLPIAPELVDDLKRYVAALPSGKAIFPLPHDKGAAMLRKDLKPAKIPYRDSAGLVFDFHSLRCELATLADAAGASPRVVQRLVRHSKLEMTNRYTRHRAANLESAAMMVPSLKPATAFAATGTDGKADSESDASAGASGENIADPNIFAMK
jgi:integrase